MRSLAFAFALALSACGPAGFGSSGDDDGGVTAPEPETVSAASFTADVAIFPSEEVLAKMSVPEPLTATLGEDGSTVIISGTTTDENSGGKTTGVAFVFRGKDEQTIGGNKVNIRIIAKGTPGSSMKAAYSTREVGNSGWQPFDLTEDFAEYSFEMDVAAPQKESNDYLGIIPVGGDVTVSAVGVDILEALPEPEPAEEPAPEVVVEPVTEDEAPE